MLVSRATGADGAKANGGSAPVISGDGRHVAFGTLATNLDPADEDSTPDSYVRDLRTAQTTLVTRADGPAGVKANDAAPLGGLSGDGRLVVFSTTASNLDPADADAKTDVYVRDVQANETTLVSRADGAAGAKGNGDSPRGRLSADGRYVAFSSAASNLVPADADPDQDVFVRDLQTEQTILATPGVDGAELAALSADGRHLAYIVRGPDRQETDTIGVLYVRDLVSGATTLVSRADGADGAPANGYSRREGVSLSADGRYIAFSSRARNLDPADTDRKGDVYVRDLEAGDTTLVSRADGPGGSKGNRSSGPGAALSADGRYVAFTSYAWNLDPADSFIDNSYDVFLRDLRTNQTTLASRAQSGARGNGSSRFPSLSADGRYLAFISDARNLDPADRDGIDDGYVRDLHAALPPAGRAPRSRIVRFSFATEFGEEVLRVAGRASDDHGVQLVELSLTRRLRGHRGCQAWREVAWARSGRAGRRCRPRFVFAAHLTRRWSRRVRAAFPRGRYEIRSRAVDTAGQRETRFSKRRGNLVRFRIR